MFIADPGAPIAAVAKHAGVGISALYRRFASKEVLLQQLCSDGLDRYIAAAEASLEIDDPWTALADFMRRLVDSESSALTIRLAGTFTPTEELYVKAACASGLGQRLFDRARDARVIRADAVVEDLALIQEALAGLRLGDDARSHELRHRYLSLTLDALHRPAAAPLPGRPPTVQELTERWG